MESKDIQGMMEAYAEVYTPQELTEEQIWEDVKNWVNSLVEEGYDLSEYTWEDMYEAYIAEIAVPPKDPAAARARNVAASRALSNIGSAVIGAAKAGFNPLGTISGAIGGELQKATQRYQAAGPRYVKGRPIKPAAVAKPAPTAAAKPTFQSTGGAGRYAPPSKQIRITTDAAIDRKYGLNQPRPAAPAPAPKPAGTPPSGTRPAPKPTTTAAPIATAAKPTPTPTATAPTPTTVPPTTTTTPTTSSSSLSSQLADLQKMRLASQMRQKGANVVSTQLSSLDLFDLIKGHLMSEGYADTEEAALKIMSSMSEEWKQSIIEEKKPIPTKH